MTFNLNNYNITSDLTITLEGVSLKRVTGGKDAYFFLVEAGGDALMLDYKQLQALDAIFKGLHLNNFTGIDSEL